MANKSLGKYAKSKMLYAPNSKLPPFRGIYALSDEDLGCYLAGLIEGDGYISPQKQIVISIRSQDIVFAYALKHHLGHGNVIKVKDKNAYVFIIANDRGVRKVLGLINGKLRLPHKLEQLHKLVNLECPELKNKIQQEVDTSNLKQSYWLAGFSDADSSFQIKMVARARKDRNYNIQNEVRVKFQIAQKIK